METKTCKNCGKELPINQFWQYTHHSGNLCYRSECKVCSNVRVANWYRKKHPPMQPIEKVCTVCGNTFTTIYHTKKRCSDNCISPRKVYLNSLTPEQRIEEQKQYSKQWRDSHKEHRNKWIEDNKERIKEKRKQQRSSLSEEKRKEFRRKKQLAINARMKRDINFKLKKRLCDRIRQSINGNKLYHHSIDLLGCSIEDARKHIERQFQPGMNWDNWGVFGWHLDHIIPIASFDLTDYEQQKKCFHYTNLQPLWWMDNIMKADKIETKQLMIA